MSTNRRELLQTGGLAFLGLAGISAAEEQTAAVEEAAESGEMFVHVHLFKFKPEVPE